MAFCFTTKPQLVYFKISEHRAWKTLWAEWNAGCHTLFYSQVYFMELEKQNVLVRANSKSLKSMIICITRKCVPTTPDSLHFCKTANQAAGEHPLIKNISSKPLGSGPVFSLPSEACSVNSDRKAEINKLPFSKFYAAVRTGSHTLPALLCWFSALDQ